MVQPCTVRAPVHLKKFVVIEGIKYFYAELAATLAELESEKDIVANDPQKLQVLFREMTQMCLW